MRTDRDRRNALRAELRSLFPRDRGQLLPALHHLQHEHGYLPDWAMEVVGWHLGIPASEVYGAATSYTELRLGKPGSHVVRVCTGLSCLVKGARDVLTAAERELGLSPGQTADDGLFTLEETACGFLCAAAPAVAVGSSWHGRVDPSSIAPLVRDLVARGADKEQSKNGRKQPSS